jgi:hypothetical protein
MKTSHPQLRLAATIALIALAGRGLAWTPSSEPPRVDAEPTASQGMPGEPAAGYPDYPPAPPTGYGAPEYRTPSFGYPGTEFPPSGMGYGAPAYGPPPGEYGPVGSMQPPAGYQPPGYGPTAGPYGGPAEAEDGSVSFDFAGMRLTQRRSDDAYTLDIELNGVDPSQVRIVPGRSGLTIVAGQTAQTESEETFGDGYGFRRSYSWSSGQSVKGLPVPPDGDLSALQREEGEDMIRILIPRVASQTAPAPPPAPSPEQQ